MKVKSLFYFLCLSLAVNTVSAKKAAAFNKTNEDKAAIIEFIYYSRIIFLPVRVNQKETFLFLLDTGANVSSVSPEVVRKLNLSITGKDTIEGSGGVIEAKKTEIKSFSIGQATAKNLHVTTQDFGGFLTPPGKTIDGILGDDFLRSFSIRIDYQNHQISISKKAARKPLQTTTVPFKLDNGIPRLSAMLEQNIPADFRLDTGASLFETPDIYLNITEDIWDKLTAENPQLKPEKYFGGSGTGGDVKLAVARLKEFSFNGFHIVNPFVIVQPKAGYFARADAVGFISNNLLEKYSPVTIDYPKQIIYLSQN